MALTRSMHCQLSSLNFAKILFFHALDCYFDAAEGFGLMAGCEMVMLLAFLIRQAPQNATLIRNSKNALYQFLAS